MVGFRAAAFGALDWGTVGFRARVLAGHAFLFDYVSTIVEGQGVGTYECSSVFAGPIQSGRRDLPASQQRSTPPQQPSAADSTRRAAFHALTTEQIPGNKPQPSECCRALETLAHVHPQPPIAGCHLQCPEKHASWMTS